MPHPGLLELFSSLGSVSKATYAISSKRTPVLLTGAQGYARTFYAASLYSRTQQPTVLIHSDPEAAVISYRELSDLLGSDKVFLFPAAEVMPFESVSYTHLDVYKRQGAYDGSSCRPDPRFL